MSSLPKNGMICFEHFRMDDLVFDGFGIPFSVRSGAAPYFVSLKFCLKNYIKKDFYLIFSK